MKRHNEFNDASIGNNHWNSRSSWNKNAKHTAGHDRQQKCAQCHQWQSEGETHGRKFYCLRCCAKWEQKDNFSGASGGNSAGKSKSEEEQFLIDYKSHWLPLVEAEWVEEQRVVFERMKWPLPRLIEKGFCVADLQGKTNGSFFGKTKVIFSPSCRDGGWLGKHQFTSGDEVIVSRTSPTTDTWAWKGEVLELRSNAIVIVSDDAPRNLRTGLWRLDCGANKTAYERTKAALGYITGAKFTNGESGETRVGFRRLILGEVEAELQTNLAGIGVRASMHGSYPDSIADRKSPLTSLNQSQQNAVRSVLNQNLGLIQGPPGTGKTTCTCAMIQEMVKQARESSIGTKHDKFRVLVAADSNVAVDQLLSGLAELSEDKPIEGTSSCLNVLRIGFPSKVSEELRKHTLLARSEEHPLNAQLDQTREKLQKVKDDLYGGKLKGKGKGLAHRDIFMHVRDLQKIEQQMTDDLISSADVVCTTLIGAGCDALLQFRFDVVVIDEASQASEPRCLVAVQKGKGEQVILVGDQRQLPPTVLCQEAEKKGLGVSLFDRMIAMLTKFSIGNSGSDPGAPVNMLEVQYRMHPLIRQWPSQQFYEGRLQDGFNVLSRDMQRGPIFLIDTSKPPPSRLSCIGSSFGKQPQNKEMSYSEGSKYNLYEIMIVRAILEQIVASGPRDNFGDIQDIGIISPYAAQVGELKAALDWKVDGTTRNCLQNVPKVEIKTVDGFQGREKDAIILSCVRTQGLGFLSDHRRLNVAITRAKKLLVVVGNASLLGNGDDPVWTSYMEFLRENAGIWE